MTAEQEWEEQRAQPAAKEHYADIDGAYLAVERLAEINPAAFDDVLELAYAYLWIYATDREELACMGLVSERACLRAHRMVVEAAGRRVRDEEKATVQ